MSARPIPESALAARVVAWLAERGWSVYQEVQIRSGSSVADIVATQGRLVWVVECKTSLSLAVIEQAQRWTHYAHLASVAVPPARGRDFARQVLRWAGVGVLAIGEFVTEQVPPPLHRRARADHLRSALREEQRTYAPAGNAEGRRWSPWRSTCDAVARAVRERPGISLRELLASVTTHYASESSARSSLTHWIEQGKVAGVRLEREGRRVRLYPREAA